MTAEFSKDVILMDRQRLKDLTGEAMVSDYRADPSEYLRMTAL